MDKVEARRKAIVDLLQTKHEPVKGSTLAEIFGVSRQVIVQDIAILKAEDHKILSTRQGYQMEAPGLAKRTFKVIHGDDEIEKELHLIVDLGGVVEDVHINHRVYGVIRADLDIASRRDVKKFLENLDQGISQPLKDITGGYHYHTVLAESEEILDEIEEALYMAGMLREKGARTGTTAR